MYYRRFWWFSSVFVSAYACKLYYKVRATLTFFRIVNRTLVQAGTIVGKFVALSGLFSPQHEWNENESESAYKYPGCPISILTKCPSFLGMSTLSTIMQLNSQKPTFMAWIYQNRCLGILNLRTSFSAVSSSEQWSHRHSFVSYHFFSACTEVSSCYLFIALLLVIFFSKNRSIY